MSVTPPSSADAGWRLESTYAALPKLFYVRARPVSVTAPQTVLFNRALAEELGLKADALDHPDAAPLLTGNLLPAGAEPLAQAYAGHQYGHFTTLGDGRAILLGEQVTLTGGRFDIQLKGSGQTPFSRRGDGRAALGPMLREYIISEAMHALGIPTTRSLAVATTGEAVYRPKPLPGAVLTRVAASHIRVGTFEWAAGHGDKEALRALADYTRARHYPETAEAESPYLAFLQAAIDRQAALIARWQQVGFIHGVMNTDNMALSGETIDYGPCAFMDAYDPATVFSSIDQRGRYAYANQPPIAQWNLARLAEALLPLLHEDEAKSIELANLALEAFIPAFQRHWLTGMRGKLGMFTDEADDAALVDDFIEWMRKTRADFTLTFRTLAGDGAAAHGLTKDASFRQWHEQWTARLSRQPQSEEAVRARMQAHNPAVIPRNHKVEEALQAAVEQQDYAPVKRLLEALARPYDDAAAHSEYSTPPPPGGQPYLTYCGT
ncbi:YdiU family protein [Prosthecobacter sp. SYSU 5D2]|uniref:protein adenylyltransferase SelO n=1 Tax=Prosthecobacter sp. SYSU 5D2 TaxID=3134134 RepID=UPI0031FF3DE6